MSIPVTAYDTVILAPNMNFCESLGQDQPSGNPVRITARTSCDLEKVHRDLEHKPPCTNAHLIDKDAQRKPKTGKEKQEKT